MVELEGSRYPDHPTERYFEEELRIHEEMSSDAADDVGPFVLPLAPDRLHKDNVSGGSPYGVFLPDRCVDGLITAETTMLFAPY